MTVFVSTVILDFNLWVIWQIKEMGLKFKHPIGLVSKKLATRV